MKSFETLYSECQSISSDSDADTLALFKKWLNQGIKKAYALLPSEYFYTSATDTTVDGNDSYPLPYNCAKIHSLKVTIGSRDYVVSEFPGSENQWLALIGGATTASESSYPQYFFPKRNTYEIYPASSTDDYTITMRYQIAPKDLSQDDYTTESIKTATNGSTAIVGNTGTDWTAAMVGRFFKVDDDGEWYQITARGSATALTLAREYGGTSIADGTSDYTIGEMSLIPKGYQELPESYALWKYYTLKENLTLATNYKGEFYEGLEELKSCLANLTTSGVIGTGEGIIIKNPNDYPSGLS